MDGQELMGGLDKLAEQYVLLTQTITLEQDLHGHEMSWNLKILFPGLEKSWNVEMAGVMEFHFCSFRAV